jgi:class 3 adenylate cyclase
MDPETLSLTEIIKLQTQLSEVLKRRFERNLALGFSDLVNGAAYFANYGDEAGRRLQQLHLDLIQQVLSKHEGRLVDTAGGGAFTAFPTAQHAAAAFLELQQEVSKQNRQRSREHQLQVRVGIHHGPVLTDGTVVTGDSVNLCARITGSGAAGEIRLTQVTFSELSKEQRLRCRALPPVTLKGIARPVEVLKLEWIDPSRFPTRLRIKESGEEIPLPVQDTVTFGRLREQNGILANDIVLSVPDKMITQQVSRWHFELRRQPEGFLLRTVTEQTTEVDGQVLQKGAEVPLSPHSVVKVARVLTLEFMPDPAIASSSPAGDATANFRAVDEQGRPTSSESEPGRSSSS